MNKETNKGAYEPEWLDEANSRIASALRLYDANRYARYQKAYRLDMHDVFDRNKRPDEQVRVVDEVGTGEGGTPRFVTKLVNRIGLNIEQDIVNIHTSFCVGNPPSLNAEPDDAIEKDMLDMVLAMDLRNKIGHHNKRVVRSFFAESIVAEYWYAYEDEAFYRKKEHKAKRRLKCAVWSPFRGDKLVPIKDNFGNLIRFYRYYTTIDSSGSEVERVMEIDNASISVFYLPRNSDGVGAGRWELEMHYSHGFDKIPVIYMDRDDVLYSPIINLRERLETLLSNNADALDENQSPKLLAKGEVSGISRTGKTNIVSLEDGGDLRYLTWNQSPDAVNSDTDRLIDLAYQITSTPRISPKDMQGAGNAFSGESFRYVFMGAHMSVRNHEESIGEFLQRRYNFIIHAISLLVPSLKGGEWLEVNPTLNPFTIDSVDKDR